MNGPQIYIEEVPTGVRTIASVATSSALFVGWACKGPTDRATQLTGFADFERVYGGLDHRAYLGYAVRHFYHNGGVDAYVIRLTAENAVVASCSLGGLNFEANSPGQWANNLNLVAGRFADDATRFKLLITDRQDAVLEAFDALSITPSHERYAPAVLNRESRLLASVTQGIPTLVAPDGRTKMSAVTMGDDGTTIAPDGQGDAGISFRSKLLSLFEATGIADQIDFFSLMCVPGLSDQATITKLLEVARRQRSFLIVDSPKSATPTTVSETHTPGSHSSNGAIYYPWVMAHDPIGGGPRQFPPCGFLAGIYARTDAKRGVWKAPAGIEARIIDALEPANILSDGANGQLNQVAINCLRKFPIHGTVVWGARTMQGADGQTSDWKYVPVRRLALFIEESLFRGTRWVTFESNDEALWAQIRLNAGAFLQNLFRQGAFRGNKVAEAWFVKCDSTTTTPADIQAGIVSFVVGFAPLKPAEFVVVRIEQIVGANT